MSELKIEQPIVIHPVLMRDVGDCSIACLCMLLGRGYHEIYAALPRKGRRRMLAEGITVVQMVNVAKKFDIELEYQDEDYDEDAVGMLYLERTVGDDAHTVLYMKGIIFHPGDGSLWTDMDSYLKTGQWKVEGFLQRKE